MAQDEGEGRKGGYKSGVKKIDENNILYWASCEKTPAVETYDDDESFVVERCVFKRKNTPYVKVYHNREYIDLYKVSGNELPTIVNLKKDDKLEYEECKENWYIVVNGERKIRYKKKLGYGKSQRCKDIWADALLHRRYNNNQKKGRRRVKCKDNTFLFILKI